MDSPLGANKGSPATPNSGSLTPSSQDEISAPGTPNTGHDVLFSDESLAIDDTEYILVTGGLGFIGSHTTLELLKAGYNVIIVDDLSNSFRDVFDRIQLVAAKYYESSGKQCPLAKLWDIDYRNLPAMRALLTSYTGPWRSQITGVIHFAAFKAVEESIQKPLKYYRNNINGLVDLLGLLEEFDIKNFIFSSSATVYGTLADRGQPLQEQHCVHQTEVYAGPNGESISVEQGCTGLTNPYGRTKFFGEAILADLANSDPSWNITALRYFNPIGCDESGILGEDPKGTPSNLVPVVVKVMTGQWKELSIFGDDWDTRDGTAIRDFIHVTDLARGHIAALKGSKGLSSDRQSALRIFNLGTGAGCSVAEIVSTMEEVAQLPIPRKIVGRRPGDVGSCVAVADQAERVLGWKTEKSLRDACRDICRYLEVNQIRDTVMAS
ncbi:hypothetical protein DV736_g4462, partial [Chaetothyriales sp. CBS 134916]